jgi:hypothetical protein
VKRQVRIERVMAIGLELRAAEFAAALVDDALLSDSGLFAGESFKVRDYRNWKRGLSATYLIRIFAEFEAVLRDVWATHLGRDTHPRTLDLVDAVAGYQMVPDDIKDGVQAVRRYRNSLVHEGGEGAVEVPFTTARSYLGTYLSRLPPEW